MKVRDTDLETWVVGDYFHIMAFHGMALPPTRSVKASLRSISAALCVEFILPFNLLIKNIFFS